MSQLALFTESSEPVEPHIEAAVKWIELGWTSARNPIHEAAFKKFFVPFGIGCDYILCDPVTSDVGAIMSPTLAGPRWRFEDVDASFLPLFPAPELFPYLTVTINRFGQISVKRDKAVPRENIPALDAFQEGKPLSSLMGKSATAAARYIRQCWMMSCMPDSPGEMTALFIKSPTKFAGQVIAANADRTR